MATMEVFIRSKALVFAESILSLLLKFELMQ